MIRLTRSTGAPRSPELLFFLISFFAFSLTNASAKTRYSVSSFNANEIAWSKGLGTSSIEGRVMLGHCDRNTKVVLAPVSAFENEITSYYFGNLEQGIFRLGSKSLLKFKKGMFEGYIDSLRYVRCINNDFRFNNIPAGSYYLKVSVTGTNTFVSQYGASASSFGYSLMRRVTVGSGESVTADLSAPTATN